MRTADSSAPMLLTGMHRSGTTWVARMLAASGELAHVHEPLNRDARALLSFDTATAYRFICAENEDEYLEPLQRLVALDYPLPRELARVRSARDAARVAKRYTYYKRARARRMTPLVKDPFAVFSVEWFRTRLNCRPVIVVRHPVAVVGSLKRLGWTFDFQHLLGQSHLLEHWLHASRDEMEKTARASADIVKQGALLWKLIHTVVASLLETQPDIADVRHEDLSEEPIDRFRELYEAVGLRWTESAAGEIRRSSCDTNPIEAPPGEPHTVVLNSAASLDNWRHRLLPEEVLTVRRITEEAALHFYGEDHRGRGLGPLALPAS